LRDVLVVHLNLLEGNERNSDYKLLAEKCGDQSGCSNSSSQIEDAVSEVESQDELYKYMHTY
jgi:hypothetical protein